VRGVWRTLVLATAAFWAAVALYVALTLPPAALRLPTAMPSAVVNGAYHMHTDRSDGTGSVDDVAKAAARAGLAFVIITDHGDATRPPDAPAYRHGVLCIDAVEISTDGGHLVALGLTGPAPYPLGGAARDVIDDVHRLGGAAIAAHPDSPKPELRWRGGADVDGIEWLSADSEWRDESSGRLLAAAARSTVRGAETLVSLFARPRRTLQRWDSAARSHRVFGLAAVDAHARIGWDETEEPRRWTLIKWPSYFTMFRTLTQSVVLDAPLAGDAPADARRLLDAIRQGRSFSVVAGIARPGLLDFGASQSGVPVPMGGELPEPGAPATFHVTVPGAPGARVALMQNGREVATARGTLVYSGPSSPGPFRAEVYLGATGVPWLASNPIFSLGPDVLAGPSGEEIAQSTSEVVAFDPGAAWTVERDPESVGGIDRRDAEIGLRFRLAGGAPAGQYSALSLPVDAQAGFDRVQFTVRASRPMRLSVQLRLPGGRDGQRWRRSVYVETTPRTVVVPLREFEPVGSTTTQRPIVARVRALLFVVDTVNTAPGTAGQVWLSAVGLGVGRSGG
jgi:PHP domain